MACFASVGTAIAQEPDRSTLERESLAVFPAVYLDVVGLEILQDGDRLSESDVREHAASVLDSAGVAMMDEDEWRETIGQPALYLRFNLIRASRHLFIYHVASEVRQLSLLVRDTTRYVHSRTWSGGEVLGTVQSQNLANLLDLLDPMLIRFANDYRRARREYLNRGRVGVGL